MVIRPAVLNDAEAIAKVHVLSWQKAYLDILAPDYLAQLSIEERSAMWAKSISQKYLQISVAEIDEMVAGFISIGPSRDDDCTPADKELWAIYVAPQYWSMGVGRNLWLQAEETLKIIATENIYLWVFSQNERARGFYEAVGFKAETNRLDNFYLGGKKVEKIRYRKTIKNIV